MKDIKILVAAHKQYQMPQDPMYLPIHVGAQGKESIGYQGDHTQNHISNRNNQFCELTALYWGWKNLDCSYLGLAHYRRHFKGKNKGKDLFDQVLTLSEADVLLDKHDIIVTKKRQYYIENIYDHYAHTLYVETLDEARHVIEENYPEYIEWFDKCMKHTYMHAFNMFIMKKELLDEYCEWLFDILFEVTDRLKDKEYSAFHNRYPGRVSELLLDVWLDYKGYSYIEVPFIYMEPISKVKKVYSFLCAKFFKKKYGGSF